MKRRSALSVCAPTAAAAQPRARGAALRHEPMLRAGEVIE
jgi:hypothetical protein